MIDFVEEAMACRDIQELWDLHCSRLIALGFPRLMYGSTKSRDGKSLGAPEDALMLTNHGADYVRGFVGGGLFSKAPMTRWCMDNTGACSWRWVDEQDAAGRLSPEERRVHQFSRSHGLVAGYTISFVDLSQRTKAAMSLGAPRGLTHDDAEAAWARHGREVLAICNVAHLRYASLPHHGARRPLTPRQREVLEWIGQGKTSGEAANAMGLTVATVEKHLRLAREALGVDTTPQAVFKAGVQNQIYVL
ncbi:MAG: LuxR family transcriptional regulator [Pseudomonadota bacterium]